MGKLKVLPAQIANMIAAGEVVQRPASVVKELMENAVDASASEISVIITDAGRTLIQVIDNGCGMSPADALLCFERHATSKISSPEDLEGIVTYGFRGEALASIAAVSDVTLKTRRQGDETATQVVASPSAPMRGSSVAAPVGSNFSVRNLFYNTPARRKFLKSDSVEFRHIVEEFTRVAITRPELSFNLKHNGKDIFVLRKAKGLKFRVLDLLGSGVIEDLVDISAETSVVKVMGFVGKPELARKTVGNQFFFVNGRFFRSAYLHKAVMKAYEELIPQGLTPSYFIFLEVDPKTVDVNIHPTKAEVKFEDDSVIFQILFACIKETLGHNNFGAGLNFDTDGAVELPQLGENFEQYRGLQQPEIHCDPLYNPFGNETGGSLPNYSSKSDAFSHGEFHTDYLTGRQDFSKLFDSLPEEEPEPPFTLSGVIYNDKYIFTPVVEGLMVVNISRARQRIDYEQNLSVLKGEREKMTQISLFPVTVQVGVEQRLLFEQNSERLEKLGFEIAPVGEDSISVSGVPEGYSCEPGKVTMLVGDLVMILSDETNSLEEIMLQRLAEKFATLGASNSAPLVSGAEAQKLLETLFACNNPEITSNGRKIISIIPTDELNKRF